MSYVNRPLAAGLDGGHGDGSIQSSPARQDWSSWDFFTGLPLPLTIAFLTRLLEQPHCCSSRCRPIPSWPSDRNHHHHLA